MSNNLKRTLAAVLASYNIVGNEEKTIQTIMEIIESEVDGIDRDTWQEIGEREGWLDDE
jgi:hypothetical protein